MDLILIKCSFITYLFQSRHFIYDKGPVGFLQKGKMLEVGFEPTSD